MRTCGPQLVRSSPSRLDGWPASDADAGAPWFPVGHSVRLREDYPSADSLACVGVLVCSRIQTPIDIGSKAATHRRDFERLALWAVIVSSALPGLVYGVVRVIGSVPTIVDVAGPAHWSYFVAAMYGGGAVSVVCAPFLVGSVVLGVIRRRANGYLSIIAAISILSTVHFLSVYGLLFMGG